MCKKKIIIELDEECSKAITIVAVGIDASGNTNIKTASMSLDGSDCHHMHIGQDSSTNEVVEC